MNPSREGKGEKDKYLAPGKSGRRENNSAIIAPIAHISRGQNGKIMCEYYIIKTVGIYISEPQVYSN